MEVESAEMKRKQSLEVLSVRVSDLLEGLDDDNGNSGLQKEDVQLKFVRFRQKLENLLFPKKASEKAQTSGCL